MSVAEKSIWMRESVIKAEAAVEALAEELLKDGVSERAYAALKSVAIAVCDKTPPSLMFCPKVVDGKLYQDWKV